MWVEKVYLQPCKGYSNSPVVFRASTVRKNSTKRIMTQSLDSPLRYVHCFQSESITGGHSPAADQKNECTPLGGSCALVLLCSIGRPEVELAFYSVGVWPVPCGLLRCVCDELSDDLRHIICPRAEGPFELTYNHMNFLGGAPLLPPYICLLHSNEKPLSNNYIPRNAQSF